MESVVFHRPHSKPIQIRKVWQYNLDDEFEIIGSLVHRYPYVSMDTEFPGVIYKPDPTDPTPLHHRSPDQQYQFIKKNVDELKLIQLGLTLSDHDGNLPEFPGIEGVVSCIWEFNFRDFDPDLDPHNSDSISLLKRQGIDFVLNRKSGIRSRDFGWHVINSGLLYNESVTWVTFHSAYDFAYLVKILLCADNKNKNRKLPWNLNEFLDILRTVFGGNIYDMKHVMQFCGSLYGGLEQVAKTLDVDREAGVGHQAGSDSLLTWRTFAKMRDTYFEKAEPEMYAGVLYGLKSY